MNEVGMGTRREQRRRYKRGGWKVKREEYGGKAAGESRIEGRERDSKGMEKEKIVERRNERRDNGKEFDG